jgi:hypothetical protein
MDRLTFIGLIGGSLLPGTKWMSKGPIEAAALTLLTAPIELGEGWDGAVLKEARAVLTRLREVSLRGIRLVSDQQPAKLRVDDNTSGPPHIWLHKDPPDTAWIVVDVVSGRWAQLAYQFGHELGHVLCNSWRWKNNPQPPTQWLEEAIVEAFSIRGLALLADSWKHDPPLPGDTAYAVTINRYRANLLNGYSKAAQIDFAAWLRDGQPPPPAGISAPKGTAVAPIVAELEGDERCVVDLGAINRWPERTALPLADYLRAWEKSCTEVKAPGLLPGRVKALFGLV